MWLYLLIVIGIATAIFWIVSRQIARGISSLWIIATAIKYQLPLPDLLEAQAAEFKGSRGRKMQEMADMLREGALLPVVVENYKELFPPQGRLAIRVGGESGTLAECLESTANDLANNQDFDAFNQYYLYCYLLFVVDAIVLTTAFLFYFILPRFKEIFIGFGVELPWITMKLLEVSDFLGNYLLFFIPLLILLIFLNVRLAIPVLTALNFFDHLPTLKPFIRGILFPFNGMRDYLRGWFPQWASAELLRYLTVNATAGKSLLGTLESLSRHYPSPMVRKRYEKICLAVEQGEDLWGKLAQQRFLTAHQAAMLQAAESAGHLPYALREINRMSEAVNKHRWGIWLEIFRCLAVILLNMWCGFIALSLFMPLLKLINDLM